MEIKEMYLMVSDIHGEEEGAELVKRAARHFGVQGILSAGDQCPDPSDQAFYSSLISVRGNCDRFYEYGAVPFPPRVRSIDLLGHRIEITHGDLLSLDDFDLVKGSIFLHGHTHVPMLEEINGIYSVNPGSPSRPRSSEGPTAVLFSEDGLVLFSLLDFSHLRSLSFSSSKP